MQTPRPDQESKQQHTTPIPFSAVQRFDSTGKELDLEATLGEIVKATFNHGITEESGRRKIQGTLRVECIGRNVFIQSDNAADLPQLRELTPWLGTIEEMEPVDREKCLRTETGTGVRADIIKFDHQFIFPYFQALKNSLAGKNPLEVFLAKRIKEGNDDSYFLEDVESEIKLNRKLQKKLQAGKFINFVIKDSKAVFRDFATRYPDEETRNAFYLMCLSNAFKGMSGLGESLVADIRNSLKESILDSLKTITAKTLLNCVDITGDDDAFNETTSNPLLHNLLEVPDIEIRKAVLQKMNEANIDLNHFGEDPHLFCYLFATKTDSTISKLYSPLDKEEFIRTLFAADVNVTDEVRQAIKDKKIDEAAAQYILAVNEMRLQKVTEATQPHLTDDPIYVTETFMFDTETLKPTRFRSPPAPQAMFPPATTDAKPATAEEARLVDLYDVIKKDTANAAVADITAWLSQARVYAASQEKILFKDKDQPPTEFVTFKKDLRKLEETVLESRPDTVSVIKSIAGLTVPECCPPVLHQQITEITEKMQQRYVPD